MRHDAIRDTFAKIMDDVCYDVEIEPHLQPLQGESFDFKTTTTSMSKFLILSQKAVPSQSEKPIPTMNRENSNMSIELLKWRTRVSTP